MKKSLLAAILLTCVFPALALAIAAPYMDTREDEITVENGTHQTPENAVMVSVLTEADVVRMELEEYVCCVVLGEMPADFEVEALKAQAVVARTYTSRKMRDSKHSSADVCTDASCCQAFCTIDAFLENGGTKSALTKVKTAVYETQGEVLHYNGQLIEATYFSCSGGRTEDAEAVWGADVPYLQSVDSPGEENAIYHTDTVIFSVAQLSDKLNVSASDLLDHGIGAIVYTRGGGVATIEIGGITFSGTRIRQMLGLRSTAFVITWAGESVTVTTKGFGHRVGMSQYGAEAMAVSGENYETILYHYYPGTALSDLFG